MGIGETGAVTVAALCDEFSLAHSNVTLSQFYRGAEGSQSVVQPNAGSNLTVPSSGAITFADFRGAGSATSAVAVQLTLDAQSVSDAFREDLRKAVASRSPASPWRRRRRPERRRPCSWSSGCPRRAG
jgi:hypothetical protein